MKQSIFLLILLMFVQICFAQESSKAILADEVGKIGNDDLLAHYDPFINQVRKPNAQGYIIIYGNKNDPLEKYLYERRIKNCRNGDYLNYKNLHFVFGKDISRLKIQFWLIPTEAEKPIFQETLKDFKLKNFVSPRLVYSSIFEEDYCPLNLNMNFYSAFLKANNNLTGKIVIREKTLKSYTKTKNTYLREIVNDNNVEPKQLVFVKGKYNGASEIEFWYVPGKN